MEDIDVKQLEELKAILSTNNEYGYKREKSNGNLMTVVAFISLLVALGGFLFAFISNKVEPISQRQDYMETRQLAILESINQQVKVDTESLKNRAALEERFKEVETQFKNNNGAIEEIKQWKDWWVKTHYRSDIDQETRLRALETRFETLVKDVHSMMRQKGGGG